MALGWHYMVRFVEGDDLGAFWEFRDDVQAPLEVARGLLVLVLGEEGLGFAVLLQLAQLAESIC
jgi:hypothetical protein